jgi:hypothetical protein
MDSKKKKKTSEELLRVWGEVKKSVMSCKASEKTFRDLTTSLENRVNNLVAENNRLREEKNELTDKLLLYQECYVIAVKKDPPKNE